MHCLFVVLALVVIAVARATVVTNWDPAKDHPCTVAKQLTYEQVIHKFGSTGIPPLYHEPVVIRASQTNRNELFQNMTRQDDLLRFFGNDFPVTLSSSNSLSENRRTISLEQHLQEILSAQETTPDQLSNESWYLFGETYSEEWQKLLQHYELPPCYTCNPEWPVALAFGIGNRGSGVQWHTHGPGFSEAIHGRKHWVLYPPGSTPKYYHKDQSSRQWMETAYWKVKPRPLECTLQSGDLIYFPDRWWHGKYLRKHFCTACMQ